MIELLELVEEIVSHEYELVQSPSMTDLRQRHVLALYQSMSMSVCRLAQTVRLLHRTVS